MDFFHHPHDNDPADAWKNENGEALSKDEQKEFVEKFFWGSSPPSPQPESFFGAPLDPHAPVELFSGTGKLSALCAAVNARFKELGFLNGMVKDQCLFMTVFVSCKSCLRIERKEVPGKVSGLYFVSSHKFLSPKTKEK